MNAIKQLLSFNGRANRMEWWLVTLGLYVVVFLSLVLVGDSLAHIFALKLGRGEWRLLFNLILLWPLLAVGARRCHDRDMPAGWTFIQVIPLFGTFWALIDLGLMEGTDGPNQYGGGPRPRPVAR
ncbi:DUF805 domain-containing protein [soil metagenome]